MPLQIYRRAGRRNLYIRGTVSWFENGERCAVEIRQSAGTDSEEAAQGIIRQIERDTIERNVYGKPPPRTFNDLALAYLNAGGDDRFLIPILTEFENTPVHALVAAEGAGQALIDEGAARQMPDASPSTLRRQWHGKIITVLNHAGVPHRIKRPKAGHGRRHWVRPHHANAIIRQLQRGRYNDPFTPALVTTLFGAGTRMGETLAVDGRDDVFMEYNYFMVRDTKNGKERVVHMIPRVRAAFSRLPTLGQPGPLFRRYDGKPYKDRQNRGGQIRARIKTVIEDIGLDPEKITPHTFRHSWATWHYAQHRDPLRLMEQGGWASLAMVQNYAKLARPELADECRSTGWALPLPIETADESLAPARGRLRGI